MAKTKKKPAKGQFGTAPKHGKITPQRGGVFNPAPAPGRVTQIPPRSNVGTVAPAPGPLPAPDVAPPQELPGWEADPAYQQALAQQLLQQQQADAQYAQELAGLGASTGLFDAQGNPVDQGQVEQLNPFSQAALLRRSWRQAQQGGVNSYAAAGQLYSGALKNAVGVEGSNLGGLYNDQQGGYNSFNYQAGLGGIKSEYNQRKGELDRWRLGVGTDAAGRVGEAAQGAADRFIENRVPVPAPPRAPGPPEGYGIPTNKGQPFTPQRVPRVRAGRMVLKPPPKRVRGPGKIRPIR